MKIIIEDIGPEEEDQLIIRCKKLDDSLLQLIYRVKMNNQKLPATKDGDIFMIDPRNIYYFESVDNKVFLYGQKQVYEVKRKLYELEQEFAGTDFLRVSKSTIVNLSKIVNLTPAFNGRFEAVLQNGERLIISRQYVSGLKKKLGL